MVLILFITLVIKLASISYDFPVNSQQIEEDLEVSVHFWLVILSV
jgi:hypothetical protein